MEVAHDVHILELSVLGHLHGHYATRTRAGTWNKSRVLVHSISQVTTPKPWASTTIVSTIHRCFINSVTTLVDASRCSRNGDSHKRSRCSSQCRHQSCMFLASRIHIMLSIFTIAIQSMCVVYCMCIFLSSTKIGHELLVLDRHLNPVSRCFQAPHFSASTTLRISTLLLEKTCHEPEFRAQEVHKHNEPCCIILLHHTRPIGDLSRP